MAAVAVSAMMASTALALPEGRAYEMVSPAEKGGNGVSFTFGGAFASESGDRVLYPTFGALPGSSSNTLANPYVATQGWPAWTTRHAGVPVDPYAPALSGHELKAYGVSDDRTKTVVAANAVLTPDAWQWGVSTLPLYLYDTVDGSYRLITPRPVSGTAPYGSVFDWGDSDYSHLLFTTTAELTTDAAPLSDFSPKVYKWADGAVTLESKLADGTAVSGSGGTFSAGLPSAGNLLDDNAISHDGEVSWFTSPATLRGSLYRREGGETFRVDESENTLTAVGPGSAWYHGATPDGSKVLFISDQPLVEQDTDGTCSPAPGATPCSDLYMYTHSGDPDTDRNLTLISAGYPGGVGNDAAQGVLGMSDSGDKVYFVTGQQIVAGAPTRPGSASRYIYVWDRGVVRYLGATTNAESADTAGVPAWNFATGNGSTRDLRHLRAVAASGDALLLASQTRLDTPAIDDVGPRQVYLYRPGVGGEGFICVSCPPGGPSAESDADLRFKPAGQGVWTNERRNLSEDGGRAFFETTDALLPRQDSNGQRDVYMWEDGQLSLVSSGRSEVESFFMDASADGDSAFFLTWDQLSGWDQDGVGDLYVARVGGGLPEPVVPREPCVGEQCQGQVSAPPGFDGPASRRFEELGDAIAGPPPSLSVRRVTAVQRRRLARGRGVGLRILVGRAGMVRVTVRARVGGRMRVVARGRGRALEAGTTRVRVRLSRPARRALARGRVLRIRVSARSTGASETDSATVRLKRTPPRRAGGGASRGAGANTNPKGR
ncbi:MAG TPA: hypothetical protein VHH12_16360 [Mycobacterium sp.]|nr:hypothetical protein [Mycobacterium sp.]